MNKSCYLCNSKDIKLIHRGTRDNSNINVMECCSCKLVFLSSFDHIKDIIYEESEMHIDKKKIDINKYREKTRNDDLRRVSMLSKEIMDKHILDFGCGNGGFIKYASEVAKSKKIKGVELENKERYYLINEGFEIKKYISEYDERFDLITMFHVLEHLVDPICILKQLANYLNDDGEIIIEVPNADEALIKLYNLKEFKDFTYWSFHAFLYNIENIDKLIYKSGFRIKWKKQIQRYSLANHLYWLAHKKPNGHNNWIFLDDDEINKLYKQKLEKHNLCDTIMISIVKK
ncbi:Methyltransferase [human gut metagenome]|uniref:Methyltransferase n=1 Tax=human gut metagenome TaxID=408170 RepID=W1Y9S3_9ZZZZ